MGTVVINTLHFQHERITPRFSLVEQLNGLDYNKSMSNIIMRIIIRKNGNIILYSVDTFAVLM